MSVLSKTTQALMVAPSSPMKIALRGAAAQASAADPSANVTGKCLLWCDTQCEPQ